MHSLAFLSSVACAAALSFGATHHATAPRVASPAQHPVRHRLQQPVMQMWGGAPFHSGDDASFSGNERDAAYRAQRRAMHKSTPVAEAQTFQPPPPMARQPPPLAYGLEAAWVLIFNEGTYAEGAYAQGEAGQTSLLAFEYVGDADKFAQVLQTKGYDLATPLQWDSGRLTSFCQAAGYEISIVPRGELPSPPAERRDDTQHELGPRRMGGPAHRHQQTGIPEYGRWLEKLLSNSPDSCNDDMYGDPDECSLLDAP